MIAALVGQSVDRCAVGRAISIGAVSVDRDKQIRAKPARDRGTLFENHIGVPIARQGHSDPAPLQQFVTQSQRKCQRDRFLPELTRASARILSAVSGIYHHQWPTGIGRPQDVRQAGLLIDRRQLKTNDIAMALAWSAKDPVGAYHGGKNRQRGDQNEQKLQVAWHSGA